MQLIDQMLNSNANAYPDNDALIVENTTLTYRELIKNINKLANGLRNIKPPEGLSLWRPYPKDPTARS
jgi:non-ribosomal peptide synthetase component E (peptide arylation enzyme)